MTLNTYEGLHARRYDVVYGDKPYGAEARFVDSLIRGAGTQNGRLLDVACGTGRHAASFAKLGWEVTCVDYSESLLDQARLNAPDALFLQQDMRELDVPGGPFDAVTCLFDSIGYPQATEGVLAALAGMRRHIAADGVVVIEFLHAPALLGHASPLGIRRWPLPEDGELIRVSKACIDEQRRVMVVSYELLELNADGTYERWEETQANRFFSVAEMDALLTQAGLHTAAFLPAYRDGRIDDRTFHVIAVAKVER